MYETTRSGDVVSGQIGVLGAVPSLSSANFKIDGDIPFNVKNDGESAVFLDVRLVSMEPGQFVNTRFDCGWNPEIVVEIKTTNQNNLNLKWGY